MCVWAEVTSRFPPVWFGNPSTAAQLPAKPPLDLPETQNHYVLFAMEGLRRREEDRTEGLYFCLRRTLEV